MIVKSIKTEKISPDKSDSLQNIIEQHIISLNEKNVVIITSKIVSITQGRVIKKKDAHKNRIIEEEADLFLPLEVNKHGFYLTIKDNILIPSAGIDESNAGEYYILWPEDPHLVANNIREFLKDKFKLQHVGVIITDSTTAPLRWGVRGISVAHSGFNALNDYVGKPDIFGRP